MFKESQQQDQQQKHEKTNRFSKLKFGLQYFAEDTTFHGLKQLYFAKSIFFRVLWVVLLTGACTTASFQIVKIIERSREEPTTSVISPLEGEAVYPPLLICYAHWMYWIDWQQAETYGFDRDTLLYAVSFWKEVYSRKSLNVTYAVNNLQAILSSNNFTLFDLYGNISRNHPLGIESKFRYSRSFHWFYGTEFCYTPILDWNQLKREDNLNFRVRYNESELLYQANQFVENEEYNKYVTDYIEVELNPNVTVNDLSPISTMIYADGSRDQILINSNYFEYNVKLKGTNYKWLNMPKSPCNDKKSTINPDYDELCGKCQKIVNNMTSGGCVSFEDYPIIGRENVNKLCRNPIYQFAGNNSRTTLSSVYFMTFGDGKRKVGPDNCSHYCDRPCEQWLYERTIIVNQQPRAVYRNAVKLPLSIVFINYPSSDKMLLVSEKEAYTWETFLGNIGGILGLWLGASVVSFFQMVYLCFFKALDESFTAAESTNKISDQTAVNKF